MSLAIHNLLPTYFPEEKKLNSAIWGKELVFSADQLIHLIAPSGSGKTSLMHFLYGMRNDYTGSISYNKESLKNIQAEALALLRSNIISIVFQDLRLFPELTIRENLEVKRQLNPFHSTEKIEVFAERLGIAHKLNSKAKICSYGEQQRTAIIRALLQPFQFLLLDEPFSHLDDNNAQKALSLIAEEAKLRKACVLYADLEKNTSLPFDQVLYL